MSNDALYWIVKWFFDAFLWGGELVGEENLPAEGPAVFVANHAAALGPIAVAASLPVRLYPWVIADMLDWDKAAAYLNKDFVEPQLHVPPRFSLPLAKAISQISVRLLSSVGSVPVYHGEALRQTFEISLSLLEERKSLLIFPEDPDQPMNEQLQMTPFKKGFARLGELFYERTRQRLRFYPLVVHVDSYRVKLGKPITFNPKNSPANERLRIKSVLEETIHEMYSGMAMAGYFGIPLPH